ncbi:MAG: DNA-binding protein [Saprospiraceae bacterium]|nr:DNA-binding protein [Saprospiraceae bacterium]
MPVYAIRLTPGQDLRNSLDDFTMERRLGAGYVITCVGSLKRVVIRPADRNEPTVLERKCEIVSLTGTLSADGSHLHIAVSDGAGATFGGHLLPGSLVYTTAEIVIGDLEDVIFKREIDGETGYKELKIYSAK